MISCLRNCISQNSWHRGILIKILILITFCVVDVSLSVTNYCRESPQAIRQFQ